MLPETISYTGLTLRPEDVLRPRKYFGTTYPMGWTRFQFFLGSTVHHDPSSGLKALDKWISNNIDGRWGSYSCYSSDKVLFVLYFEYLNDAVMFRLKDGVSEAFLD